MAQSLVSLALALVTCWLDLFCPGLPLVVPDLAPGVTGPVFGRVVAWSLAWPLVSVALALVAWWRGPWLGRHILALIGGVLGVL